MKVKLYDRVVLKDGCEASIVEIFENGKVHISIKLNENGDLYRYGSDRIIVSEVATARFFLNEMMKQRKQILENKKLAKIKEDF